MAKMAPSHRKIIQRLLMKASDEERENCAIPVNLALIGDAKVFAGYVIALGDEWLEFQPAGTNDNMLVPLHAVKFIEKLAV